MYVFCPNTMLFFYSSSVVQLQHKNGDTLFGIVLDILDIFMFPHVAEDCPLTSVKNYIGILIRIALNTCIACCRIEIFNYINFNYINPSNP